MRGSIRRRVVWLGLALGAALVLTLPAAGVPPDKIFDQDQLRHFSQGAVIGYFVKHPSAEGFANIAELRRRGDDDEGPGPGHPGGSRGQAGGTGQGVFNDDDIGLPQNEESVSACPSNPRIVLGGTNDYRGLVEAPPSVTGWHFSNDGGRTLTNEGRLPAVTSGAGQDLESGGDPVDVAGKTNEAGDGPGCAFLYASSLAYQLTGDTGEDPSANGIAVYRTTPETLASCPSGPGTPACWPVSRVVAEATGDIFLDKEWMDVGWSGDAEYVWVTYTRFVTDVSAPEGFTSAEIEAVRCTRDLASCTTPIPISEENGPDLDTQFSDVTIGPDGRVYVTWSEIVCELTGDPDCTSDQQHWIHKVRVAEPGSIVFSPEQVIYEEEKPIPFLDSPLHANEFRIATYAKSDVALIGRDNHPRIFIVWEACKYLFDALDQVCEEPKIKLMYSDDPIGTTGTWHGPFTISRGGDNYFPSIASNDSEHRPRLAFTWFTNRYDYFHNAQDVEFATMNPASLEMSRIKRLTGPSNEPEADPSLEGVFIGDYIEVFATGRKAWVHFNANYRYERALEQGIPVPQQDNYLVRLRLRGGHHHGDHD